MRHLGKARKIARTGNWKHFRHPAVVSFVPTLKETVALNKFKGKLIGYWGATAVT